MFDAQALFSDNQAITATAASDNFINLGNPATPPLSPAALKRDIGGGNNMPLAIMVTEDFAGLKRLKVDVQIADNDAFTGAVVAGSTGELAVASLTKGAVLPLSNVPIGTDKRYVRLVYTVSGTATAGKIMAGIATAVATNG